MDQLSFISSRTVAHLQKAALNLKGAFEDFGVLVGTSHPPPGKNVSDNKRATLSSEGEPSLDAVVESPPLVMPGRACGHVENKENRGTSLEDETPARTLSRKQPRRSELFRPGQADVQEFEESTPLAIPEVSPLRGSPTPTSTPLVAAKRAFYETPAVPMAECDTVRRKRAATLKIKSMVEPKLNNKLRRPGRNDEPHPFISSLY
ncbi:hypothetical protein Aduo_008717 [Ancylostoma duodenale]